MGYILLIFALIVYGMWVKYINHKHMERLANKCFEEHRHENAPSPLYGKKNPCSLYKRNK